MSALLKAKGPAEVAASPSRGSSNLKEGMAMNTAKTTTAPVAPARDAAFAASMRDLEDDICSLSTMTRILGELLDNSLVEVVDGRRIEIRERGGRPLTVLLGHDEKEMLAFAWNDVINRSFRLKNRYYEAFDAGDAA